MLCSKWESWNPNFRGENKKYLSCRHLVGIIHGFRSSPRSERLWPGVFLWILFLKLGLPTLRSECPRKCLEQKKAEGHVVGLNSIGILSSDRMKGPATRERERLEHLVAVCCCWQLIQSSIFTKFLKPPNCFRHYGKHIFGEWMDVTSHHDKKFYQKNQHLDDVQHNVEGRIPAPRGMNKSCK